VSLKLDREFSFSFASVWAAIALLVPATLLLPSRENLQEVIGPALGWLWILSAPIALVWGSRRMARERTLQSLLEIAVGALSFALFAVLLAIGEKP
jgi:hypothetical protein